MSNYIENEKITGNNISKSFILANPFKAGTLKITWNGALFYEFKEDLENNSKVTLDLAPSAADDVSVSYHKINQPNTYNAIRYLTVRQARDLSRVSAIAALTGDAGAKTIESLIREAEGYIDSVVGYWQKYHETLYISSGQRLTFPRANDDPNLFPAHVSEYAFIPPQITTATLYAVENLFLQGEQEEADDGAGAIISKSLGDFSYSKQALGNPKTPQDFARLAIGKRAVSMINGFIKRTGRLTVSDKGYDGPLNSRQLFLNK